MRCLISILAAILAILAHGAQGAEDAINCTKQFYVVNTFKAQNTLSISCLGLSSSCKVYYSPPGNGCNEGSPTLIGTVGKNETQNFTSDFALGGGFCSDTQFVVYASDELKAIVANLPKATEAGTKFHQLLVAQNQAVSYQCIVSALELPANITFDDGDSVKSLSIASYGFYQTNFKMAIETSRMINVMSNNPVIVSCSEDSPIDVTAISQRLVTLQPISPEPLLVFSDESDSAVFVVISDCSTNELITDFSKFSVSFGDTNGKPCESDVKHEPIGGGDGFYFTLRCTILFEPLDDNVCLSATMQAERNKYLASVGIPQSTFSTRFPSILNIEYAYAYSFSLSTCTAFTDETDQKTLELVWTGGNLTDKVAEVDVNPYYDLAWMECEKPTLMLAYNYPFLTPILAGYQTLDLWQPFLDSQCYEAPSSSNARSLVNFMNWAFLFGFVLLLI